MLESLLNINPERIAVTELFGAIGNPTRTTEYIRMLRAIEENRRIRALVIDIDSPGGAAGPSEYVFESVRKTGRLIALSEAPLLAESFPPMPPVPGLNWNVAPSWTSTFGTTYVASPRTCVWNGSTTRQYGFASAPVDVVTRVVCTAAVLAQL